ncbi:uncharacterized protein LOC141886719 isoform X2 [Acropora palmata]|uniref:uncharacterized protein LOC141886719 isoform X2 n=2 Tax=Acropora palmata TaxID=6131 RepID=UPI003DA0FF46
MKLSLFPVTLLLNKAKNKKRRRGGRKRARCSKAGPNHRGKMDAVSLTETENNDSTSSMSCVNEFETERSPSDVDEDSTSISLSQALRTDKTANFLRSLLSGRTPYEDFHRLFKNVPRDQFPINDFSCALSREILLQGRIYISQGWFCFYSNIFGWETEVTIDCRKIQSITREKTAYVVPNAILICTDSEKHFFSSFLSRETVYKLLVQVWGEIKEKQLKADKMKDQNQEDGSDLRQEEKEQLEEEDEDDLKNDLEELNDLNAGHSCSANYEEEDKEEEEEEEEESHSQQTRRTSTERLREDSYSEDVTTKNIKAMPRSSKDQLSPSKSARITSCAGVAMLLASIAETVYSYSQVTFHLVQRLTREQLFYISTFIMIMFLMMCSLFLLHRISTLEPKMLASTAYPPEKILLGQSAYQLWKLRQEIFNAEVVRFKTILAANLNAMTQVRQTLKKLEVDLEERLGRNCSFLDDNVCVQI